MLASRLRRLVLLGPLSDAFRLLLLIVLLGHNLSFGVQAWPFVDPGENTADFSMVFTMGQLYIVRWSAATTARDIATATQNTFDLWLTTYDYDIFPFAVLVDVNLNLTKAGETQMAAGKANVQKAGFGNGRFDLDDKILAKTTNYALRFSPSAGNTPQYRSGIGSEMQSPAFMVFKDEASVKLPQPANPPGVSSTSLTPQPTQSSSSSSTSATSSSSSSSASSSSSSASSSATGPSDPVQPSPTATGPSEPPPEGPGGGLPPGTLAAILGSGGGVVIVLFGVLIWWILTRRRKAKQQARLLSPTQSDEEPSIPIPKGPELQGCTTHTRELDGVFAAKYEAFGWAGNEIQGTPKNELEAVSKPKYETQGTPLNEVEAVSVLKYEMEAEAFRRYEMEAAARQEMEASLARIEMPAPAATHEMGSGRRSLYTYGSSMRPAELPAELPTHPRVSRQIKRFSRWI